MSDGKFPEQPLRLSEEHYRNLVDHLNEAIYAVDTRGCITYISPAVERISLYKPHEVQGREFSLFVHPDDLPGLVVSFEKTLHGELEPYEFRIVAKDGTLRYVHTSSQPLYQEGELKGLIGVVTDISAHKRAEEQRAREHALLSTLIAHLPDHVYVKDREGRFLYANAVVARLMGAERAQDLLGKTDADFYPPEMAAEFRADEEELTRSGRPLLNKDERRIDANGDEIFLVTTKVPLHDEQGNVVGLVGVGRDLTERLQLEEQLRQLQKMESIGRLAGGIAHDFNNLLTAISGNLQLALMDLKKDRSPADRLEQALKAIGSAAHLTQQLLAFSRKQIIEPKIIDLNDVLLGMRQMLSRLIGEGVQLVLLPGRRLGRIKADPGQIEQIIISLAVNARDAMPEGGNLTIETENAILDDEYCKRHRGAFAGEHVRLTVSDTGVGMSKEVVGQIFEPFFTTKSIGKGTGLGLAMVYGAVKQNGGSIEVYSEPGHGTTLRIYLPRASGRLHAVSTPFEVGDLPRGSETILVVEDESSIREFTEQILRRLGYSVISCAGVREAIDLASQHVGPIHALLTDVVLPDGNARILAESLARKRPEMRVLFTSGYPENVIAHQGVLDSGVQFIGKPFTVAALANKLREVLK